MVWNKYIKILFLKEYMNRRKMMEFGGLALTDMGQDEDENGKNIRLLGVRKRRW